MADNYIDYPTVEACSASYSQQAEAIAAVISALDSANDALVQGFRNQTSQAFIERYEAEYKKGLAEAQAALESISQFLNTYMANRMEEDSSTAGSVAGG
nr:WXG100 family type VII secretion target [uncultured Blautia sp.]